MQHINTLAQQIELETLAIKEKANSHESSTFNAIDSEKTFNFWLLMSEIYGAQWAKEYGLEPPMIWVLEIEKLSIKEIQKGVQKCIKSGSGYVPKLPQFLSFCSDEMTQEQRAFYAKVKENEELLRLPKPAGSDEVRKAELAKMRRTLCGL
jgi:hypothetical protein